MTLRRMNSGRTRLSILIAACAASSLAQGANLLPRKLQAPPSSSGQWNWTRVTTTSPAGATSHWLQLDLFASSQPPGNNGCLDGTVENTFSSTMVGCAGVKSYTDRGQLCASGWTACTAAEWVGRRSGAMPTFNFWTNESLKYSGTGSNNCAAEPSTGTSCGANPMRVCKSTQPDARGNNCNWVGCGYDTNFPNEYFGGCINNTTAGTLCCARNSYMKLQYCTSGCTDTSCTDGPPWTTLGTFFGHISYGAQYSIPPGTVTVRACSYKATAGYLDTHTIDNVVFGTNKGTYATHRFEAELPGTTPVGWTSGGNNGGWKVQRQLPARMIGRPRSQGANTTTYASRNVYFNSAAGNVCHFDYLVDTAETHYLRVYADSVLKFQTSGAGKRGRVAVDMGASIGYHALKFEFVRDGNATAGRNLVRVGVVSCLSDGVVVDVLDFDGQTPDAQPFTFTTGCSTQGGSCSGVPGFVIHKRTPHSSYVPKQTPVLEPVVNGMFNLGEYPNPTRATAPHTSSTSARRAPLWFYQSMTTNKFYIAAQLEPDTTAIGSESGHTILYFDENVAATLAYAGCGAGLHYPDARDRQISFDYSLTTNDNAIITGITQKKGSCGTSWTNLAGGDVVWPVSAAVSDTGTELNLEIAVTLPTSILSSNKMGFGFARKVSATGSLREHFPYREDADQVPKDADAYSWETVYLESVPTTGPVPSESGDNCCFPENQRNSF